MNCKQGDLAILVNSYSINEGKIVTCIRYIGRAYTSDGDICTGNDYWEIDTKLPCWDGSHVYAARDSFMRPIRGDLLNDEITTSKELEAV